MFSMVPVPDAVMGAVSFISKHKMMNRDNVLAEAVSNGIYEIMCDLELELQQTEDPDIIAEAREIIAELIMEE